MSDSNEQGFGLGGADGFGAAGGFDGLIDQAHRPDGFDWQDDGSDAQEEERVISVLRFQVGARLFAVPSEYVREIVSDLRITSVPGAPSHVRGVAVFRRQVLGVLNLGQWLDPVAQRSTLDQSRIVIVEAGAYTVGIEASVVSGMDEWPGEVLDRSGIPESINTRTRRYAAGIRLERNEATVLLDVPKLLDDAAVQ